MLACEAVGATSSGRCLCELFLVSHAFTLLLPLPWLVHCELFPIFHETTT